MRNKDLYKAMLAGVQAGAQESDGQPFNDELIEKLKVRIQPLEAFFGLSTAQTIVLSYFIDAHMKDLVISKDNLITHFGKDITAIADIEELIEELAKMKYIFLSGGDPRFKTQYKTACLNPKVIMAMMEGDVSTMEFRPSKTFSDFLLDAADLILQRYQGNISRSQLDAEMLQLIEVNRKLREVKWIRRQRKLKGAELLIFIAICVEQTSGEEEVDIEKVLRDVFDSQAERLRYRQAFKTENSLLFKENYIVSAGFAFGTMSYVQLSDETINQLLQDISTVIKKEFTPRTGHMIETEKMVEEKLFYNPQEAGQVHTLTKALEEESYQRILHRMRERGMTPGFTVLLYGYPGTGKTSSVKAIAKATGRNVFMIDIPKINSKWVGESEKNLSRVFDEYRRAKKYFGKHPILLFNEADAILGKRMDTNSSVDKMNNTLQNILLQELEDFEGIFMATTNLANHLDGAFDRRLLYKIEFHKPRPEVQAALLQSSFPGISDDLIDNMTKQYSLTGGQISNIRKKMLIRDLLEEDFQLENEVLALCEDEQVLRKNHRPTIGFQHK